MLQRLHLWLYSTEGGQRTNNKTAAFSDIQVVGPSISSTDDKESTLLTNKIRTISINDPLTNPISKEPDKPKGMLTATYFILILMEVRRNHLMAANNVLELS